MAKLTEMPEQKVISGFRGVVDFYYHMGIPVARMWPRNNLKRRSPAVQATWPAFSYASREWTNLSQAVKDAYERLATDSGLTGRDMFERSFMVGLYQSPA